MARRVTVREEASFTAMTPEKRPARVRLHLRDGSQREKTVTGSKGDPDQPMSKDELQAKFHSLVHPVLGSEAATAAWEKLGQLAQLPHLDDLTALLVPAGDQQKEVRKER